jgi:hypothetical protein
MAAECRKSSNSDQLSTYPTKRDYVGYITCVRIPQNVILWDMAALTTPHERALTLLFAELERSAAEQLEVLLGTPGTLSQRTNETGTRFWAHRYSDALNRRQELYLGKVDDPKIEGQVRTLREMIETANLTIARVRLLARAGFATVDRKAYFTLASLHNHGLFRAGALLVGSHAYGALLNALGVRAAAYATEDVDIARRESLAVPGVPGFLDMLRATGIEFLEIPSLDRRQRGTSFKERGGSNFTVDLLVPSPDGTYPIVPVPGLKAHAQGLPHLAYLLSASQEIPVLSTHGSVMVRVPVPERYAIHKLIVSQLRNKTSSKPEKDLFQAAALIEAVAERYPGAIEDAASAVPKSAVRYLARAIKAIERHVPPNATAAWDILRSIAPAP